MARLRNRIRKAGYYSDGELLRWHRDKRETYAGLWALAEDSGCLEDDPFGWKLAIWPAPADADITVEILTTWRDELVTAGKLIPYEVDGKRYLFIRSFHNHERPTNPQQSDLPLPPWVACDAKEGTAKDKKRWSRCLYRVIAELLPARPEVCTESVQTENGVCTSSPALLCTALSCPALPGTEELLPAADAAGEGFSDFWAVYPRRESRKKAAKAWHRLGAEDRRLALGVAEIMAALVAAGRKQVHFVPYASTFLNNERWMDWSDGVPPGWEAPGAERVAEQVANLAAARAAVDSEGDSR